MNVALPSIQQSLGAGESAIEWIVAGYGISTAVLLVTGGRLGDQFGRRRVFAIGMTVFVLTSAACALAPDPARRPCWIAGSATLTMKKSRTNMNVPIMSTASADQDRPPAVWTGLGSVRVAVMPRACGLP